MRGFTDFGGRLTRLVYSRERGTFVSKAVPHPFEASEASLTITSRPDAPAACPERLNAMPCPTKGGKNDR